MSSRVGTIIVFLAIAGFVGGSIYVIGTRGTTLLAPETKKVAPADPAPPPSAPAQAVSEPASPSPVRPAMELEAAQRVRSGVYRCIQDGAVVFADQPCPNGSEADRRPRKQGR
jgi:hypothetical protein